jgi:hypothetical protein
MILSTEQQTLVAQLVIKQDQPEECFGLIGSNAKTRSFGQLFEKHKLVKINKDTVDLLPAFYVAAHRNGVTDEHGNLTEDGEALSKNNIEETYRLFRAMLSVVS